MRKRSAIRSATRNHCPVADHSPRACSYPLRPFLVSAMICRPTPDAALVARRADIVRALRALVRAGKVIDDDVRLAAYETDARIAKTTSSGATRTDGRGHRDFALSRARRRQGRRRLPFVNLGFCRISRTRTTTDSPPEWERRLLQVNGSGPIES